MNDTNKQKTVKVPLTDEQKRARRAAARKQKNELMASLGLTRVRGCVSGETYWE